MTLRSKAAAAVLSYGLRRIPGGGNIVPGVALSPYAAGSDPMRVRDATTAVATRMSKQQECPLVVGTPFTVDGAMRDSAQARVVTEAAAPHTIVYVNRAWEKLCGYSAEEVLGIQGLGFLQGPLTASHMVEKLDHAVNSCTRGRVIVTNYKKDGTPFQNLVQVTPLLGSNGRITHLLGILQNVQ